MAKAKRPRRDLNIKRPPKTVNPIPDEVWRGVCAGIGELFQKFEAELEEEELKVLTQIEPPAEEETEAETVGNVNQAQVYVYQTREY